MEERYHSKKTLSYITLIICSIAIAVLLWSVCNKSSLLPIESDTSILFLLLFAAAAPTIAAITTIILHRNIGIRFNLIDGLIALMAAYMVVSALSTNDPQNMLLAKIALLFTVYFNLRVLISYDKHTIDVVILGILLMGIYQGILAGAQLFGKTPSNHTLFHVTGSFYNPGPFGGFLAMVWGLALFHILRPAPKDWWQKVIYNASIVYILIALLILPATQSRIAWIAAIATTAAIIANIYGQTIRQWLTSRKKLTVILASSTLTLLLIGGGLMYTMKRNSADGRLLMWKVATNIIVDNPILGVGLGTYGGNVGDYQAAYFASAERNEQEIHVAGTSTSAFNEYIQCTAELGLVGLAGMLLIGLLSFLSLRKSGSGLQFALIALSVFALASYPLSLLAFGVILVLILAIAASKPQRWKMRPSKWLVFAAIGIVIVLNIATIALIYPLKKDYEAWQKSQVLYRTGRYSAILDDYTGLIHTLRHEPQFLFEYAKILNHNGQYVQSNQILQQVNKKLSDPMIDNIMGNNYKALGEYLQTEASYTKAYNMVPNRIYPLYLLTLLYDETGQSEKMRHMAQHVLDFREKVPSSAAQEIKTNVRKLLNKTK